MPVRGFALVARPLIFVLNGSANLFLRALGITPQEELSGARTPQELASLVRRSAAGGHARRGHRPAGHQVAGLRRADRGRRDEPARPGVVDRAHRHRRGRRPAGATHRSLPLPGDRRGLGRHRRRGARQARHRRPARAARRRAGVGADGAAAARARDDPARPAAAHAARARAPARDRRGRVRRHGRHRDPRGRRRGDRRRGVRRARRVPHDRARVHRRVVDGARAVAARRGARAPGCRRARRARLRDDRRLRDGRARPDPHRGRHRRRSRAWQITVLAMDGMRADRLRFVPLDADGRPGRSADAIGGTTDAAIGDRRGRRGGAE